MSNRNETTCDGVWVEVPGFFCHIEESRDDCFCPGWQFTEENRKEQEEET